MKRKLILFAILMQSLAILAQTDSIKVKQKKERKVELSGQVYDSFTKAKVKAFLTLMTAPDSTVVDTMTCWTWGTSSYYEFKVPARNADYIIKGTCEGYEDAYLNYQLRHIARNNFFELPRLLMKKKQRSDDDIYKEIGMEGVVITGTKVKLAYRGDTLVYNASAFNLPEGSMLDGLIRQMPGAELKDNGDIYINGRKVDYLTLNGKDFFKGQNQVMLDNLPYFTVRELKVYDKSTKQSQLLGHDVEKKDYVMDVQLKREYNRGFMANAEAGRGTEDRYMGRLFGLYYDDNTRLSLFGNVNNVNETRRPGSNGEWSPAEMPVGLRTTKMAGMNLNTEDSNKRWEETFDANVTWSDAENETRSASETFATVGSIFRGSHSQSRQKDFRLHANNHFQMEKPFILWSTVGLDYSDGDRHSSSQDSTYRDALINRTLNSGLNTYRTLTLNASVGLSKKFEWGDYVTLSLNGSYSRSKPAEGFSLNDTHYYAQGADSLDRRHFYTDGPKRSYDYRARLGYTFQLPGQWYVSASADYHQAMADNQDMRYRLDRIALYYNHQSSVSSPQSPASNPQSSISNPQSSISSARPLDWLPSTREALASVIDDNSSTEFHFERNYGGSIDLHHTTDNSYFAIELPVEATRERLHLWETYIDTLARRSYTTFSPGVSYFRWNIKSGLQQATYRMNRQQPSLSSLMPTGEDANPLAIRLNNPGLKASTTHNAGLAFVFNNDSTRRFASIWTSASIVQNAWGTRTLYVPETGGYIFQQDNINGNWNSSLGASYQRPLDPKKRLTLTQRNDVAYNHSVDFNVLYVTVDPQSLGSELTGATETPVVPGATASPALSSQPEKSTVHNLTLSETLKLEYQKDKLTASVSAHLDYRLASSRRESFQRINAFDFDYGMTFNYTIPFFKLDVATDLRMYSRRGYYSSMMNDNHMVWNAQLSRSFLKGRMTARLQAFDLLHQLSNTQYTVNAQGRTETWQQCIPRYVMLSLAYKLSQKPKR